MGCYAEWGSPGSSMKISFLSTSSSPDHYEEPCRVEKCSIKPDRSRRKSNDLKQVKTSEKENWIRRRRDMKRGGVLWCVSRFFGFYIKSLLSNSYPYGGLHR
jgi:hypothetical protein